HSAIRWGWRCPSARKSSRRVLLVVDGGDLVLLLLFLLRVTVTWIQCSTASLVEAYCTQVESVVSVPKTDKRCFQRTHNTKKRYLPFREKGVGKENRQRLKGSTHPIHRTIVAYKYGVIHVRTISCNDSKPR
ncbi:unnamed protein product, partial [Ectocarpus fasciculatus]